MSNIAVVLRFQKPWVLISALNYSSTTTCPGLLFSLSVPVTVRPLPPWARKLNGATRLVGQPGEVQVPTESREDVSDHRFWKRGTTAMFYIRIVNLDVGSYLHMTPEKYFSRTEKEKKDLYLQACLKRKRTFTQMVYSADRIPGAEALAAH